MNILSFTAKHKRLIIAAGSVIAAATLVLLLYINGVFHITDRIHSPNGEVTVTVYENYLEDNSFTLKYSGTVRGRSTAGEAEYLGLWWSPDSRYVLVGSLENGRTQYWLTDLVMNISNNFSNTLNRAAKMCTDFDAAPIDPESAKKLIDYSFIEWDADPSKLHFTYEFTAQSGENHSGRFIYDRANGMILLNEPTE